MDLVMIILTVFLGGIVLVLATLCAWFGPSVNSVQSFFRKAAQGQQAVQGQQATQSSSSPDQAVDQHAGAGGMFSTHIIALHDGGSCMSLLTVYTSYVCVCSEWMI